MEEVTNGAALFDIGDLRSTDTAKLAIVNPATGQPTTWEWELAGPGHPASIAQSDRQAKENLHTEKLKEQARVNRKKWIQPEPTPEEVREKNALFFAERVLGWSPVRLNGEDYPFSRENCVKLLLDPTYGRIYSQIAEYFAADDSFTDGSAKT